MKRDLILLSILCFFLAIWGGTPYAPTDFLLRRSSEVLLGTVGSTFFHKPGLIIYINAVVYGLILLTKQIFGASDILSQWAEIYFIKGDIVSYPFQISIFFPGQVVTACFSVLGAISTYLAAFRLTGKRVVSFLAGLFLCTSLLWVADSHFITTDVPLAALCITTTLLTLLFVEKKQPLGLKQLLILGLLFGLTTSAKYNGALIFSAIVLPMTFCYVLNYKKLVLHCFLIGITGVIVFLITNPLIITKFEMFLPQLRYQIAHANVGHFGWKTDNGWSFHLTKTLRFGYGLLPLGLALVGVVGIVFDKSLNVAQKLAIITFPIVFYLFMGKFRLAFQRYMLPMLPFLSVLSSLGVYQLYQFSRRFLGNSRTVKSVVMVGLSIIVITCILPNIRNTITHDLILGRRDTREDLYQVMGGAGLSNELSIFCNLYTCRYIRIIASRTPNPAQQIGTMELGPDLAVDAPDILIFDSFSHDRLIYSTVENWNVYPEPYYSHREHGFWAAPLRQKYTNYEDLYIVQLSPFKTSKDEVPFSRKSVYSPYLPDLYFRKRPGPFIEIYCKDVSVVRKIVDSCNRNNVEYTSLRGKEAYYFRRINEELQ